MDKHPNTPSNCTEYRIDHPKHIDILNIIGAYQANESNTTIYIHTNIVLPYIPLF